MKPIRGRVDPKAQRRTYRATERFLALASPKPMGEIFPPEPEREARATPNKRPDDTGLESQVLQEIIAFLESCKFIGGIVRTNSGVAVESSRYIRYNTCLGTHEGEHMTLLDLQCIYKPTGRHIEIEAKRAGWRYSGRKNEIKQAARIAHLRSCGAVAFFADSVIEVKHQFRKAGVI